MTKKSENKYTQSQKIIKKGGGQSEENIIRNIKNRQNIWGPILPELSDLSICDLNNMPELSIYKKLSADMIIIKKKNGISKPSNYIAIKYRYLTESNGSKTKILDDIFISELGKEQFLTKIYEKIKNYTYAKIITNGQLTNGQLNKLLANAKLANEQLVKLLANRQLSNGQLTKLLADSDLALKIIKFFGNNYNNPMYEKPLSEEFYDLNKFFRAQVRVKMLIAQSRHNFGGGKKKKITNTISSKPRSKKGGNFMGSVGELVAPSGWESFATMAGLFAIDRADAALRRGNKTDLKKETTKKKK